MLGVLQPDGTLPLLAGSPAIDAGTNSGCAATDERGVSWPQNGTCDIGAYEAAATPGGHDDGEDGDDDDHGDDDHHGGSGGHHHHHHHHPKGR